MANRIVYDSNDILLVNNSLKEQLNMIQNGIENNLNDFSVLQELDLFGDGLTALKKEVQELARKRSNMETMLKNHDEDLIDFEKGQTIYVNKFLGLDENSSNHYTGEKVNTDKINVDEVNEGKQIKLAELKEILFNFSYDEKLELLKKMFSSGNYSFDSLLLDQENAPIAKKSLLSVLGYSDTSISGELEEKDIQKTLLDAVIPSSSEIIKELDTKSVLKGKEYFQKVANDNNLSLTDLLTKDSNDTILSECLKNIVDGNVDNINSEDSEEIRTYLSEVAEKNNISIDELLNGDNVSLIKGGI